MQIFSGLVIPQATKMMFTKTFLTITFVVIFFQLPGLQGYPTETQENGQVSEYHPRQMTMNRLHPREDTVYNQQRLPVAMSPREDTVHNQQRPSVAMNQLHPREDTVHNQQIAMNQLHPREDTVHNQQVAMNQLHPREDTIYNHNANQMQLPSFPSATTQGVEIRNCGIEGNIVESALSLLDAYGVGSNFKLTIDCDFYQNGSPCTAVTVEVGGSVIVDLDVCISSSESISNTCIMLFVLLCNLLLLSSLLQPEHYVLLYM